MQAPSFTEVVRQELSRLPLDDDAQPRGELVGLLRTAGQLTLSAGRPPVLSVTTGSGAVARRVHGLVLARYGVRPELKVRARSGVQHAPRYALVLGADSRQVAVDLAIIDAEGRLQRTMDVATGGAEAVATVRGALLGGGSVSRPGRQPHLEIGVAEPAVAVQLAELVRAVAATSASVSSSGRPRVVVKSGEGIASVLAAVGATSAYLEVEERRLRRHVRAQANRLANADRANLRRTIEASAAQVQNVERAIARHGWDGLDDPLREVALARLANPQASLAELGSLLDPPVGKSAIHRRLARLEQLADHDAQDDGHGRRGGDGPVTRPHGRW